MALLAACSSTKFVGEGQYLLDKALIKVDSNRYPASVLKPYLRQLPNYKSFGLIKWQLYVYDWSGRNPKSWLNKQLRRMGEPPVILDTSLVDLSVNELKRFLTNKGYTDAEVGASIDTSRRKKAVVTYRVRVNRPYLISRYRMHLPDRAIDSIAHLKAPRRNWLAEAFRPTQEIYRPYIKEGDLFDRDLLDRERQRITTLLRRNGYYAFNRDNLGYLADTTADTHRVKLDMLLFPHRKVLPDGSIKEEAHRPYFIKNVTIRTDYDPMQLAGDSLFQPSDSARRGGVRILYGKNGRSLRPGVLYHSNFLQPGKRFDERDLDKTYSAFAAMQALRNANVRFKESEENDSLLLSATILTSPAKVHGLGFDIEGTNSAGDFGAAASMNYQHRNLFKGSEVLSARLRGAYEALSGVKEFGQNNYWEVGGDLSLSFPQFLFPFLNETVRKKVRASTEFRLSYNNQTRPEYERAVVSARWGYNWQSNNNSFAKHNFNLIDVDYLFMPRINQAFLDSLPEVTRLYDYTDQFIVSSSYTYTYNNSNPQSRQRDTHSLRASVELAGNVLYGLSHLFDAKKDADGKYELFGIDYSQYAKLDFDYSKGLVLDDRNRLAFHLGAGVAVPYGNADKIPFERRYFAGGANSVRGWSVRSLGPGSMSKDSANFLTQAGDIRLEANIEYRSKLFWKFESALFADAGNIWTIRPYPDQVGGNFDFSRFYKEIALAYGIGIRLNFDFVLFRLDFGWKAYDPQETGLRRWAILRPNFRGNFAWHFGVGYPF
jgi:outer membrane protein assembly factor BamA